MNRNTPSQLRKHALALTRQVEPLEGRTYYSVHATFLSGPGWLTVFGDIRSNAITVSRDAAGGILINGGTVRTTGATPPTVANVKQIQVFGLAGNDDIRLDETNGPLPRALLYGGTGNDVLTGGSGNDLLSGQAGNDFLFGMGGSDLLFGADGDDSLTGGMGDDKSFGQAGDDNLAWAPGDETDLNEGGAGSDTVSVNGAVGSETFTVAPNGTRVRFDRTDPAPFSLDIGTVERLSLRANAGDDAFTAVAGLADLIHLTIDGGAGNDRLSGSDGADDLLGRDGNDFIDGNGGADLALLGAGDDTFQWDPGDGSDVVDGQDGADTMVFNGSNLAERMEAIANGNRLRFSRDLGSIVMDVTALERVDVNALGGADTLTVNNLSATAVTLLNANLSAAIGGATGDGANDSVVVNGTAGDDAVQIAAVDNNRRIVVAGLFPFVNITGSEAANDRLTINTLGSNDTVDAASLPAGLVGLTIIGGGANDTLVGSAGADTFVWDPGDGSDQIEGQGGRDILAFNDPVPTPDTIVLAANGPRLRLARQTGFVNMDVNDVEQVNVFTGHASNTIAVNDLSGTDVTDVSINVDPNPGDEGSGFPIDTVVVNGSAGADNVLVAGSGGTLSVTGLAATVVVNGVAGNDRLQLNTLAGNDGVDAAALRVGVIGLAIDGGAGDDRLSGSPGNDLIVGGAGTDAAFLGAGNDTFVWNPGDGSDAVDGQAGRDAMVFNGSDLAEIFGISANQDRVRFTRDLGNITMDLGSVEKIDLAALGGADKVVVNDLLGTAVEEINLDLGAVSGGAAGDGQVDSVTVNASAKDELIPVTGTAGGILVNGGFAQAGSLQYFMVIRAVEAADGILVNGNGGNDSIDASGLQTPVTFRAEGGAGNDILRGSPRDDVLVGGDGDDGVDGNGGADSAFLGAGDDTFVWDPGDGNDLVEGMAGADTMVFRGSNGGESFNLSANGNRLRFFRNPGEITMDVDDVERINLVALGGPDTVVVNDLAATDVVLVDVNLGAGGTANGDLLADSVSVNGSAVADRVVVSAVAGAALLTRPTTAVRVAGADPDFDTLTVFGLAGDDTFDASALPAGIISLGLDGGDGDDTLIGSAGDDTLSGDFGNDVILGGPGDDILIGGPGTDTLNGGPGNNVLIQD